MDNDSWTPQLEAASDAVKRVTIQIPFPKDYIYANCAAFSISLMEIRIGFGEAIQNEAVSKVGIVLPPEAAAIIAMVLVGQVNAYEREFGEIRHPAWKEWKATSVAQRTHPIPEPEPTSE